MSRPRTVRAFSAGGVLFRPRHLRQAAAQDQAPTVEAPAQPPAEVVLVGRAWEDFWVLPKGTPRPGEETPDVALREVAEETGVTGRIVGELGSIHYWFSRHGTRFNKEVFYYLMEAAGGDVAQHDHEYDDAVWFPLPEALAHLTYPNEAEVLRAAAERIAARFKDEAAE